MSMTDDDSILDNDGTVTTTPASGSTGGPSTPQVPTPPEYTPKDASVETQLTGLLSKDNPLMTKARTGAVKTANRRGLLNSSIAAQAGEAAVLDYAVPIASQQAQQLHQTNLQGMDIASKEKIAFANIAAHDREKATSAAVAMENIYGEAFRTIAQNENLPADARNAYLQHIGSIRDSNLNLIEQLYGIDLQWATPSNPAAPGSTPTDGSGGSTGTPTGGGDGGGGDGGDDDDDDFDDDTDDDTGDDDASANDDDEEDDDDDDF